MISQSGECNSEPLLNLLPSINFTLNSIWESLTEDRQPSSLVFSNLSLVLAIKIYVSVYLIVNAVNKVTANKELFAMK